MSSRSSVSPGNQKERSCRLDPEAQRRAGDLRVRTAAAVVGGGEHADRRAAELEHVARLDGQHPVRAQVAEQRLAAARHHDRDVAAEAPQRRQVQVVVVQVRDQHDVGLGGAAAAARAV